MAEIYDLEKMKVRTYIQQINTLFYMGKELENKVDQVKPGNVKIIDNITYYTIIIGE